ncbi:cysteine--tRNA ligase [Candidatus Saccharibacteria bacterium]|nr:cysteine--tRNA ligase [Candidatus Saccharibacteria bacterium]
MLKLYNTPKKSLETFSPKNPDKVKIYTCGPTVYSSPHIGNFAAYIYWDLLIRVLKFNGFTPYRVINLTDVGHLTSDADDGSDKIEKGAKKEGKTVWEIADFYINKFKSDFKKLELTKPDVWARATDYIEQSLDLVNRLKENGFLYETSDGLYFDTSKFPNYADFAHLDLKNLKTGARVAFSEEKKNPSDFAVWKFIKPGETHAMRWDYLGRPGYPGWHCECSSIIHTLLGEPIDIHAGGIDHIPVHHTNEIAQTFGAYGKKLAYFWLHCNFLTINGEKISKSLGNIITLEDIENKNFSVFDFKLWLFQGNYRTERNFTWEDLESAKTRRRNWQNKIALLYQKEEQIDKTFSASFQNSLKNALNDDLNSASAFSLIDENADKLSLEDWVLVEKIFSLKLIPKDRTKDILPKIQQRNSARDKKDYKTADKIRDELKEQGITLLDTPEGTFWQLSA